MTSLTACPYVTGVSEDCLVTLTTRIEFEQVSEMNEEQNPINALRPSLPNVVSYLGNFSFFGDQRNDETTKPPSSDSSSDGR